ncbi:sugar phosphate nucleotidyltransferase [Thiorhodovibrio frisius]|uniref:Nucleoside-diphosphate-sugar pyrophosphorylase family protein n=1 Tax=Thiorhodovibrio frisius TaxID=631362 RepID=H8YW89_9GAMM|nr:sugar phosphate nucleotidyltransferase [Thiorhodovibrio frisius]EIC23692.1 Nucleoside-diphosphate-sugar pyrophosphorylase family protein [Thiorhodovibrio frisius]WPL20078.1 Glucose-1-phosphate cytidylyltransferase [Thiorhodovibrio frisius]
MPQALILVGGQGTRLGPLTAALPKPMLDIGGRPFIDRLPCSLETDILPRLARAHGLKGQVLQSSIVRLCLVVHH